MLKEEIKINLKKILEPEHKAKEQNKTKRIRKQKFWVEKKLQTW